MPATLVAWPLTVVCAAAFGLVIPTRETAKQWRKAELADAASAASEKEEEE